MKLKSWILVLISFISLCSKIAAQTDKTFSVPSPMQKFLISGAAQGTSYQISYFYPHELVTKLVIDSILQVIDQSMSNYNKHSTLSTFNRSQTEALKLDVHFQRVMSASFYYNKLTRGVFDITVAPLVQLWGFGPQQIHHFPDSGAIDEVLKSVGMDMLRWKAPYLRKLNPKVSIDVNGIAQGYTVDVLADYLKARGIRNYIVELGGELRVQGKNLLGESFKIGIERPGSTADQKRITEVIYMPDGALTTAGNFEKFMLYGNQKITHHVNPITGYMFSSPIISVTVYAQTAMEADALDNYFMALQPEEVLSFVKRRKNLEVYLIFKNNNGEMEEKYSKGFSSFFLHQPIKT